MHTFVTLNEKGTQITECLQELLGVPTACLPVPALQWRGRFQGYPRWEEVYSA